MAKFMVTESGTLVNIDQIMAVSYKQDGDFTTVVMTDGSTFDMPGNNISYILNENNKVTMRDKQFANLINDKFKMTLSSILARLDSILKVVEKKVK